MMKISMRDSRVLSCVLTLMIAAPSLLSAQHESEGGGGLYDINPGLSVWPRIVFISLLFILKKFAWGPIVDAVDGREKGIQTAIDSAAALNAEAANLL